MPKMRASKSMDCIEVVSDKVAAEFLLDVSDVRTLKVVINPDGSGRLEDIGHFRNVAVISVNHEEHSRAVWTR